MSRTISRLTPLLLLGGLLAPAPALAHGIGEEAAEKSVLEFIPVGMEHMLLGWDHLLFVAGVLLVAARIRLAAKLISLFVLGHSTTLIIATLDGWRVNAVLVDIVIALSVVFVAVVAIRGRPDSFRWFGAAVLGFGLVHGLGLATRFQDLGIPDGGELWRVIAFNVGIEIGQIIAIFAIVAVALIVATFLRDDREGAALRLASAAVFAGGILATSVVTYQALVDLRGEDPAVAYAGTTESCTVGDRTESLPAAGDHTGKDFFEPGEEAPLGDFGHSVGDGYIAVLYPTGLAEPELGELRTFVAGTDGEGVLGGATPQVGEKIVAVTARLQLTCTEVDVAALTQFKERWFGSL